jgi:hypothetical protein
MLEISRSGRPVLAVAGAWLYPPIAVYLSRSDWPVDGGAVAVRDTKVGRGAVALFAAMGMTTVHADLASELAADAASLFGVELTADVWTDSLACRTEALLRDICRCEQAVAAVIARVSDEFRANPGAFVSIVAYDGGDPIARSVGDLLRYHPG